MQSIQSFFSAARTKLEKTFRFSILSGAVVILFVGGSLLGRSVGMVAATIAGPVAVAHADTCSVAVAMSDSASNANLSVGDTITYTLNGAPAFTAATHVTVADLLGSELTFVSASPSVGTYTSSTGIWDLGTLNGASFASLSLVAKVNPGTEGQTIPNNPSITYVQSDCTQSSAINGVSITVRGVVTPTSTLAITPTSLLNGTTGFPYAVALNATGTAVGPFTWSVASGTLPTGLSLGTSTASTTSISGTPTATGTYPFVVNVTNGSTTATQAYSVTIGSPALPPVPSADLSLSKSVDNSTPAQGSTVNYTVTVRAMGPATSTGVTATEILPSGLGFLNATATLGGYASSTGLWTIGDMSASSTATLRIAAQVNASSGTQIVNTASATETASSTDPNTGNNTASTTVTVATPGNSCTLAVSDATNLLSNGSPAALVATPYNASWTAVIPSAVWIWSSPTVVNSLINESSTFTKTFTITTPIASTTLTINADNGYVAWVNGVQVVNNPTEVNYFASDTAAFDVTSLLHAGTNTFTATVTNFGIPSSTSEGNPAGLLYKLSARGNCSGATLAILPTSLPNGTTGFPYAVALNATGTAVGPFTWSVASGTLPTGLTLGTSTASTTSISGTPTATGTYPFVVNVTNGSTTATQAYSVTIGSPALPPVPSADLSLSKSVDNSTPAQGSTVNYTVTVRAMGPATSTGVTATDVLPSGLGFLNATATLGGYASSTGLWTIGDMSASSTATLQIAAQVNASSGTQIVNTASATETASSTDPNTGNNTASTTVTVATPGCTTNCGGGATLVITPTSLPNGTTTVSYAVTLNATGTAVGPFTWSVASGTLPTGLSIGTSTASTTSISGTPTATGTYPFVVKATNGTVTATQAYSVTIGAAIPASTTLAITPTSLPNGTTTVPYAQTLTATGTAQGPFVWNVASGTLPTGFVLGTSTASTTSISGTPTATGTYPFVVKATNGSTTATQAYSVTIGAAVNCGTSGCADISVSKTVDNASPVAGSTVNYLVTATALGPVTSTFVDAQDLLPTGLSIVSATTSQGSYNTGTGDWNIGTLGPNATATLAISVVVDSRMGGQTITNTATISELSSLVDANPANNSSSVSISVSTPGCTSNCGGGGGGGGVVGVGGGGYYQNFDLKINNGAPTTATPSVTLTLTATNATQMWLSNDPSFVTSTPSSGSVSTGWIPFQGTYPWTLTSVTGEKTVYAKFGTNGSQMGSSQAAIQLLGGQSTGQVLGAGTSCGIYLNDYIHIGWNNNPDEVRKLQTFMNGNMGTTLPITGVYDQQDFNVVEQFQIKYGSQVLAPWVPLGLANQMTPTGFVYQTTKWWINRLYCEALNIPQPALQVYQGD